MMMKALMIDIMIMLFVMRLLNKIMIMEVTRVIIMSTTTTMTRMMMVNCIHHTT